MGWGLRAAPLLGSVLALPVVAGAGPCAPGDPDPATRTTPSSLVDRALLESELWTIPTGEETGAAPPPHEPRATGPESQDELCRRPTGWKRFGCDSRALGRRLLLREPGDATRAALVLGGAGALYVVRKDIREYALEHPSETRMNIEDAARNLGKGAASPIVAGGFFLAGTLSRETYHVETAQILLESTLYASLLAAVGQFVIASERPSEGDDVHFFQSGGHGVSGDVAIAASIVAPIDVRYLRWKPEDSRGVKALKTTGRSVLYAAVALTAFQRIDTDAHWAPDVYLGAAAGFTAGYAISSAHAPRSSDRSPPSDHSRANLLPAVAPVPSGVVLSWSFSTR